MYILSGYIKFLKKNVKEQFFLYFFYFKIEKNFFFLNKRTKRNSKRNGLFQGKKSNDSRSSSSSQKRNDSHSNFQRNKELFLGTRSHSWNWPNSAFNTTLKSNYILEVNGDQTTLFNWDYTDDCYHDLCLEFNFHCIDDKSIKATLNLDHTDNAQCAFQGYFKGYKSTNKMVAVTSR